MSEQKRNHRGPSAGTILVILAFVAVMLAFPMLLNTDGGSSGDSYGVYLAPVLPMTAVSGGENLEVERNVDFDFEPYRDLKRTALTVGSVQVTDSYLLTNPTGETVTVQLAYPFLGSPDSEQEQPHVLTVGGEAVESRLYGSVDIHSEVWKADSFPEFADLMEKNDYFAQAAFRTEAPEMAVKVYHVSNIVSSTEDAYLVQKFSVPQGATVWVSFLDKWGQDAQTRQADVWYGANRDQDYYLMVVGGDLEQVTYSGNRSINESEDSTIEAPSFQLEVYESTFRETMLHFAEKYEPYEPLPESVTPEFLYWDILQRKALNQHDSMLQVAAVYFDWAVSNGRMLYWVFDVEIPAGKTLEVTASFQSEAHHDIGGAKKPREGYDMATRLGSDLNFTAQSASIQNGDLVNIIRQNFGFDWEKGITQVQLDLNIERYYLEVAVE